MRYWLDTEFIEDGKTIDLISIGIEAEDGRYLYVQNSDCDLERASEWVRKNVITALWQGQAHWDDKATIAIAVRDFCDPERYGKPEFWGYYADYDWVAVCQLFGTMMGGCMNYRLIPAPNIPADFPLESLFDADQDSAYRAINDWGITPRAFFTLEPVLAPTEIYEHDFYHV